MGIEITKIEMPDMDTDSIIKAVEILEDWLTEEDPDPVAVLRALVPVIRAAAPRS